MSEGDKTTFANVTHYTQVDVQPGGINIQHVENLYQADILKAMGIELEVKKSESSEETGGCKTACITEELMPIFYNDSAEVDKFLHSIQGAKAVQVVDEVNKLITARKISDRSCNKPLWDILHRYGLYDKGINNWNNLITKRL